MTVTMLPKVVIIRLGHKEPCPVLRNFIVSRYEMLSPWIFGTKKEKDKTHKNAMHIKSIRISTSLNRFCMWNSSFFIIFFFTPNCFYIIPHTVHNAFCAQNSHFQGMVLVVIAEASRTSNII